MQAKPEELELFRAKSEWLCELSVWLMGLRSFLSEDALYLVRSQDEAFSASDFGPKLRIADDVLLRVSQLCVAFLGDRRWNYEHFMGYIEEELRERDGLLHARALAEPDDLKLAVARLYELTTDLRMMLPALYGQPRVAYPVYRGAAKVLLRQLYSEPSIAGLQTFAVRAAMDRRENEALVGVIGALEPRPLRRRAARVLLQLQQLRSVLLLVPRAPREPALLRRALTLFALIYRELNQLALRLGKEVRGWTRDCPAFAEELQRFAVVVQLELAKVFYRELHGLLESENSKRIYAGVENAREVLRNTLERSLVGFAHALEPRLGQQALVPEFLSRRRESLRLLADLQRLREAALACLQGGAGAEALFQEELATFDQRSLRSLMFGDWDDFTAFRSQLEVATPALSVVRRFIGFLETLQAEVSKREALQDPE